MLMADDYRSGRGLQFVEPCPENVQEEDEGTGSLLASLARLHSALARERKSGSRETPRRHRG